MGDDNKIPTGRVRRTAKVGRVVGAEGAKLARTLAANVARDDEKGKQALERRHDEAALKMVDTLGSMKGVAMKLGQLASFIDTDFLPPDMREIYQEKLSALRSTAPPMPWREVRHVLEAEWEEPIDELFDSFEHEAIAAASIGQVHRAVLPDGRRVAVKIQYPGVDAAIRADLQNAGLLLKLAKALAPGLDAKAAAEELKERVLEELDYEFEGQNQRLFARAYRDHPFIVVPDVISELSRSRVLVTEWVDGRDFEAMRELPQEQRDRIGEIVFRFCFGSVYHLQAFNADAHPGNYLLLDDGRVAFLDFGMVKRLSREQIELEIAAVEAAISGDPAALVAALHDIGFVKKPERVDAELLAKHVAAVGGWYMRDADVTIDARVVMKAIAAISDPRSKYYALVRKESLPADEILGRRMETGVLAVLGQLGATANWMRIGCEWWFADDPRTELGREEWAYFESRGERRAKKFAARGVRS